MKENLTKEERLNLETFSSPKALAAYNKVGLMPAEKRGIEKYFLNRSAKILDLGCGVGRTTYPLHKEGFNVIGVDISEAMIEKAKTTFPEIDFRVGTALELEFEDETFDYVLFSFNGIDLIFPEERRLKALKEIRRVLKNKGIFIFSTHNSWFSISQNPYDYYWLLKFFTRNIIRKKTFSRYKIDIEDFGEQILYFINPLKQKRQLEDCGFTLLDIIGRFTGKAKYFEAWPYYVAQRE